MFGLCGVQGMSVRAISTMPTLSKQQKEVRLGGCCSGASFRMSPPQLEEYLYPASEEDEEAAERCGRCLLGSL